MDKYLALAPYLLPKDANSPLNRPTLGHPGTLFHETHRTELTKQTLTPNNIFISPDSGAISCIIDWQHTTIELRLLVAKYPRAFENLDIEQSLELKEPKLPADYETLSAEEKLEADELYGRRLIFYYYRIFNGHLNKAHTQALRDPSFAFASTWSIGLADNGVETS